MGFDWEDRLYFASDYFEQMYFHAITMIKNEKAYVCDQTSQEIRECRGTLINPGIESPFRGRSIKENLDLFGRMKIGEFGDGAKTLRAKIDILKLIRELPITAVAVIHELALLADFADRVIVLQNGKIVADGPPRQSLSKKIVWDVFGVNLVDVSHPTSGKQFQVFDVLEQNINL